MRTILLPVPPRTEQDQIVRFLDWKVSEINKLIGIRRKEIQELRSFKNAVVSQLVTRGMDSHAEMKYSGVNWLGDIPKRWKVVKLRQILHSVSEKNHPELPLLSVVREKGVIIRDVDDTESNHNYIPDDLSNYKVVRKNQFAMNKMKAWQGSYGVSPYTGIVSPAYFIFDIDFKNLEYFHYAIRSKVYVNFFAQASDGIRVGQWDLQMDKMKEIPFIVPSEQEQEEIVETIKTLQKKCESRMDDLHKEIDVLVELKNKIISDVVTGKIDVRNVTVPEYEHVDDIAEDDSEDVKEETDGEEE
jgi:type I restriction enzyme S subunit